MKRLFCLVLLAAFVTMACDAVNTQPKKEPPKTFTNSIGMKFVWIPPGSFVMGSPKVEEGRDDNEIQHKVTLSKGFFMGVHLVTQEQWQTIIRKNPSEFKGEKNLPVEQVSWEECQTFAKKLREKDKKLYRLPTEAEWEFACRAGTKTPFNFGETISTEQANYNGNVYGEGKKGVNRGKTTPVGSFPANASWLHDMDGNVCQWCQDWYGEYPQKELIDPQGPEKGDEGRRVMRGGSWNNFPDFAARPTVTDSIEVDGRQADHFVAGNHLDPEHDPHCLAASKGKLIGRHQVVKSSPHENRHC